MFSKKFFHGFLIYFPIIFLFIMLFAFNSHAQLIPAYGPQPQFYGYQPYSYAPYQPYQMYPYTPYQQNPYMPYQPYQQYPYTPYQMSPYMPYQPYQQYPYTPYQPYSYMPYQQNPYMPYQPYQQYPYNPYYQQYPYNYYQQYPYNPYQMYPYSPYQQYPYTPTQPQFQTTDNSYTASDNGDDVDVDEGETIGIILESNASTGYRWELDTDELDDDIVSKVSSQYYQGGTLLGAGGYEQWIFEAEEPGETTIRLEYKRSGDTSAASTFKIDVTVEE